MAVFTWNNFDEEFIESVVYSPYTEESFKPPIVTSEKEFLIPSMNLICTFPDRSFIKKYRTEIEFKLLKNYPESVKRICKILKINEGNHFGLIRELVLKPLTATLADAYIYELAKIGGYDCVLTEYSRFGSSLSIDMKNSTASEIAMYDFQNEAVKKLTDHFIENDQSSGMLVMPTGSGKTRTAVYFLLKEMVSQGYQVIWLTHRHMLIDQTAQNFYEFAPLAKIKNPDIKKYKMVCVSGQHQTIRATEKDDTVKARSYQNTINRIRKYRKDAKLLGLTATPVRATENGSKQLLKLYDNNNIYDVALTELIVKGTLATPKFIHVDTDENFEPIMSIDEERLIKKYGELPETLVSKIASSSSRNKLIVDQYIKNRNEYGKTLIFALNVVHCITLCEDLQKRGVKCDYVYSSRDGNSEVIRKFQEGELEVLININIMTEGSDVPNIQTVFLTRPTQSEGLLMQMIGRGMRGKSVGGTEEVNIVDFCDKWDTFNKWLNPEWIIEGEITPVDQAIPTVKKRPYDVYSWELCRDIYDAIVFKNHDSNTLVSLPVCWYTLIDEEGEDYRMLVFEDQLSGYVNLIRDKKIWKDERNLDINAILNKYFGGFVINPTKRDIELFINNLLSDDDPPQRFILENRKSIDPVYVAQMIKNDKLNPIDIATKIYEENPMAENIYGNLENYTMKVCEHAIYQNGIPPLGIRVEELPIEEIPFRMEPVYDLKELVIEVKDQMFWGTYEGISSVEWTDKPYKTYYGVFYHFDNHIKINCVLNSPDVPREVVKYVIYHELLHRYYQRHDKAFRIEEHKYPEYTECERFLSNRMYKFDIKAW